MESWSGFLQGLGKAILWLAGASGVGAVAIQIFKRFSEALGTYGKPEIFNTDQGSQFTCGEWIDTLKAAGVQISMDGKGRWIDNVFIERLWRSVKYENIYLRAYETGTQLRRGLTEYFDFYNGRRIHEALGYATPDEVYFAGLAPVMAAAA